MQQIMRKMPPPLPRMIKTFFWSLIGFIMTTQDIFASVPKPWQIGFQPAASPTMEGIESLHHFLMIIITVIGLFVIGLLGYVIWRFRASVHPEPKPVSHNTTLEIVWTLIPALVLIVIAIPSLKLLFFADRIEKADLTLKAIGRQWYWTYEYPEQKIHFDSYMIEDKDLKPGQFRLLEVDNRVIVPVGKVVRLIVTSEDVLHSFAVPALGVKKDAVPGRLNETWFKIEKEGVYYGQCSELCGIKHGFMPIAIEAVSQAAYDEWVSTKKPVEEEKKVAPALQDKPAPQKEAEVKKDIEAKEKAEQKKDSKVKKTPDTKEKAKPKKNQQKKKESKESSLNETAQDDATKDDSSTKKSKEKGE